jgi:hypothetical protein
MLHCIPHKQPPVGGHPSGLCMGSCSAVNPQFNNLKEPIWAGSSSVPSTHSTVSQKGHRLQVGMSVAPIVLLIKRGQSRARWGIWWSPSKGLNRYFYKELCKWLILIQKVL